MLVNIVLVTKGFDANWVSGRARSSHESVGIRGAVGALKLRGPFQSERSGSGSYSLGGERVYDPSASLRAGSGPAHGSADSRQRYCANLGHRQDDETGTYTGGSPDGDGLVYMRARYYEPGTGRFVSEDPSRQGWNWCAYCANDPVNRGDWTGKLWYSITSLLGFIALLGAAYLAIDNFANEMNTEGWVFSVLAGLLIVADILSWKLLCQDLSDSAAQIFRRHNDEVNRELIGGVEYLRHSHWTDGIGKLELYGLEEQMYIWDADC